MRGGFTLVELITVLVIIGIGIGLFYAVLFVNWNAYETHLTLIDLQMDADTIIEMISFDGKYARQITVSGNWKSVTFQFPDPAAEPAITYSFIMPNQLQKTVSSNTAVISSYVVFADSSFRPLGNLLEVNLVLADAVFGKKVRLRDTTQIFPRNLQ